MNHRFKKIQSFIWMGWLIGLPLLHSATNFGLSGHQFARVWSLGPVAIILCVGGFELIVYRRYTNTSGREINVENGKSAIIAFFKELLFTFVLAVVAYRVI